jgi:DNA-binding protein Fis
VPENNSDNPSTANEELHEPEIGRRVASLLAEGHCDIYKTVIQLIEKDLFQAALDHYKGNRLKASRALGISRFTLRKKLRAMESQQPDAQPELVAPPCPDLVDERYATESPNAMAFQRS